MRKTKLVLTALVMTAVMMMSGCGNKKPAAGGEQAQGGGTADTQTEQVGFTIKDEDLALVTKLGDYKSFTYEPFDSSISREDIDDYIKKLYDQSMKEGFKAYVEDESKASDTVKNGDTVNIAFTGYVDGKTFEGGTATSYYLTIGSKTFIDGFEDQLVGAKKGDKVTVNTKFPANYGEKDLAGKDVKFEVTINHFGKETKVTIENCYKYMFGYDTPEKLDEYVKAKLEAQIASQLDDYYSNCQTTYVQNIIVNSEFGDISKLVDEYYNYYYETMQTVATSNGGSISDIISAMGLESVAEYEKVLRKQSENTIKHDLVLAVIAKNDGIKLTDETFKEYGEKYLSSTTYQDLDSYISAYDRYYGAGSFRRNIETIHISNELFLKYAKAEASKDKDADKETDKEKTE